MQGPGCCHPLFLAPKQQACPSLGISELGGTVETTSSGSAPQGDQAGQRDPAGHVISSPPTPPLPRPVFFYWCRGLHLFPLGAATVLIHREDKIPLLGTDPPWSPEVLLDGRRAHLKGARWYFTRSRILPLLPCSLFPRGERGEGEAGRVQPPAPPAQSPRAPPKPWLLRSPERCVCRRDPGSSFWRGGLCTGRARSFPRPARSSGELWIRTQDARLPARFPDGFRVVEPVGGRRAGLTRGTPLPVGHPREGAARRAD